MPLELRLLGTFAATVDGVPVDDARWSRRQAAVVVKLLALAPRHRLHQEQIMETLWPGADPDTATNGLHKMVHLARHALEPDLASGSGSRFLVRSEGQLQLTAPGGLAVDAVAFEAAASAALRSSDEASCRAALQMYEGDLLPADRYAEWAAVPRERLRALRLQLLQALAGRFEARGELAASIACLQQVLAIEPTHEPAHRALMSGYLRAGSRAQALRQFEHCRAVLRRELATEPDAATRALHERIAEGAGGNTALPAAAATPAGAAAPPDPRAVAVLPFANLTGDAGRDWLASGVAESILRALSRLADLRVLAPSTVQRYRGREVDPRAVGRELGAGNVVLGRIEPYGDRLAVSVELVRTADGTLLWGERFERDAAEVLHVERTIATAVAARLGARSAPSAGETRDPVAHEQQLRGRHEWNKRTGASLRQAIAHFERAIDADPSYAAAYVGLADCHALAGLYMPVPPSESMPRARRAAERALELDPRLAEAHTSLAYVQFAYDWDFAAAERGFQRAIELAPNYATAHQWLHELLTAMGRFAEQRAAIERAAALDPLSPIIATEIGWGLYYAREYAEARRHLERTVAHAPRFPVAWSILGLVQLQDGDAEGACETLAHALQQSQQPPFPIALGMLGHALAKAGRIDEAHERRRQLAALAAQTPAASHAEALVHLGLGDHGGALRCLAAAMAGRADRMVYLRVDPMLDALRGAPEFERLCARLQPPPDRSQPA